MSRRKKCKCGHSYNNHEPSKGWCCQCDCKKFKEKKIKDLYLELGEKNKWLIFGEIIALCFGIIACGGLFAGIIYYLDFFNSNISEELAIVLGYIIALCITFIWLGYCLSEIIRWRNYDIRKKIR